MTPPEGAGDGPPHVWVCVPSVSGAAWQTGGLLIALRAASLLGDHVPTTTVTTHDEEPPHPTLEVAMAEAGPQDVFVVTWGPQVAGLLDQLRGRRVVYYAQSQGWGFDLTPEVPVLALSQYLLGWWAAKAPANHLLRLPPVLDPRCVDLGGARDVDVLVHARKSTAYLLEQLVPALQARCRVQVLTEFVDRGELVEQYQRAKTYLYSSTPWGPTWGEGFGLQPLEARACGATVFTNLHGGLADHEDPEVDAFKLEVHSLAHDVERVLAAVRGELRPVHDAEAIARTYSADAFHARAPRLLASLHRFFEATEGREPDLPPPWEPAAAAGGAVRRAVRSLRGRLVGS
jgi:glycosyltransferase involved in cell wall biosynthesis